MISGLPALFDAFQKQHTLQRCLVGGQKWEFFDGGEGEVLLLLPGFFGVAGTDFLYSLAFEPHYRVISLTYPETSASLAELVDGLAGLMEALDLAQVCLLGGSYSGYIAQAFVRRHPQRVRRLILAQTGAPRRRHIPLAFGLASLFRWMPQSLLRWSMRQTVTWFLPHATAPQVFWRQYFLKLIQTLSQRALYHRFRVVLDFHGHAHFAADDLAAWPGSIFILESTHDRLVSQAETEILRQLYPQARHRLIPGDHVQSVDQPEAQIAAILQCLQWRP
jgi:pimeloyl-ACP methyl ester carboxylesterase